MSTIVRLRGDAEELVWPGAALRPHLDQRARLHEGSPGSDASWADRRRWSDASLAAHAANVQAFAEAQGWRVSEGFAVNRLVRKRGTLLWPNWAREVVDHPDFFWQCRRSPALVVHLYGELVLDRVPDSLVVDRLPESWYWPGTTTAYVFRPVIYQAIQSVSSSAKIIGKTKSSPLRRGMMASRPKLRRLIATLQALTSEELGARAEPLDFVVRRVAMGPTS